MTIARPKTEEIRCLGVAVRYFHGSFVVVHLRLPERGALLGFSNSRINSADNSTDSFTSRALLQRGCAI
jgi:hypothetical protein